jgi:outer membrane autotransporter protein
MASPFRWQRSSLTIFEMKGSQPGSKIDIDLLGANADLLAVQGLGTADLAGKVKPLFTLSGLGSFTQWTVLTTASSPIVDNGIEAVSTAAVTFDLIFPLATRMDLVLLGVDFAPDGLNKNETAIGTNLTNIYQAGSGDLVSLLDALAALPNVGDLAKALDQLSPEVYLDTEIAALFSALSFTNSLMTCPTRDGAAAFIKEGECVWARVSGREFNQDATTQTIGFDETAFQVTGGGQVALGPTWRIGGALGYEHSNLDTDTNAKADGDRFSGGAVVKYNPGALLLAAGVSGSLGSYDTVRPIGFPGFSARAKGDNDIDTVDGRLRAEYLLSSGNWYLKPMVDLDATHVSADGATESGAGGVGLKVQGNDETVFSATPALELGAQFGQPGGTLYRPYVRGGATLFDDPDFVLLASFEGAPGGVGPFRIAAGSDDVVGNVGAGIDVIGVGGASLRLYYDGRFGDTVEEHAGGIKGTLPFGYGQWAVGAADNASRAASLGCHDPVPMSLCQGLGRRELPCVCCVPLPSRLCCRCRPLPSMAAAPRSKPRSYAAISVKVSPASLTPAREGSSVRMPRPAPRRRRLSPRPKPRRREALGRARPLPPSPAKPGRRPTRPLAKMAWSALRPIAAARRIRNYWAAIACTTPRRPAAAGSPPTHRPKPARASRRSSPAPCARTA